MSRRKKPIAWNEPPPGALEWLRMCIEFTKEAEKKREQETFDREAAQFGIEHAERWQREDRTRSRITGLVITLSLRLESGELDAFLAWASEKPALDIAAAIDQSNSRALASLGAFTGALRAEVERSRSVREDLALCKHGVHTLPTDTPCVWCELDRKEEQRGTPDQ